MCSTKKNASSKKKKALHYISHPDSLRDEKFRRARVLNTEKKGRRNRERLKIANPRNQYLIAWSRVLQRRVFDAMKAMTAAAAVAAAKNRPGSPADEEAGGARRLS